MKLEVKIEEFKPMEKDEQEYIGVIMTSILSKKDFDKLIKRTKPQNGWAIDLDLIENVSTKE